MDLPGEAFGPLYCGLCLAWLHVWEQVWKQFCSWGSWAWRPHEQSHHSKDCPQDSLLGSPPPLTLAICLARSNGGKEIVLPVPPKTQDLVKKKQPQDVSSWPTIWCCSFLLAMHSQHLFICCYCCSVAKSHLTLCDPMDCSTPGFPVLHHPPEFAQIHVHRVSDATQPSRPVTPFTCLFRLCGVFIELPGLCAAACGLSPVRGVYSSCSVQASNCTGFPCCKAQALKYVGSRALRISSCGTQA